MTFRRTNERSVAQTANATSVLDIAAYILSKHGPMAHMKLQRLVYYSQAWHLVWEDTPLFPERIEAWANGPVVPVLYEALKDEFFVDAQLLADRLADPEVQARITARMEAESLTTENDDQQAPLPPARAFKKAAAAVVTILAVVAVATVIIKTRTRAHRRGSNRT